MVGEIFISILKAFLKEVIKFALIVLLIAYIPYKMYFTQNNYGKSDIIDEVLKNNILTQVITYEFNPVGPYAIVSGYDKNGIEKSVWLLYMPRSMKSEIKYVANLNEGITNEEAISIARNQGGIKEIMDIRLTYMEYIENTLTQNLYWVVNGRPEKKVFIDFNTGKIEHISDFTQ